MGIQPGTRIGPYLVQDLIGQGAMGLVYQAHHEVLDRKAAVKVLQALSADGRATDRFLREGRAIAQMRHPNILNVYDFGDFEGTAYMIVEYVAGGTLADLVGEVPVEPGRAQRLLRGIADAVDYAHELGVVHRDIKPTNVLMGPRDTPILADFGLAKLLQQASMTMSGTVTGTPSYMAPEQVSGGSVGPPADRYAFATMAYEMLTSRLPFEAETVMELMYAKLQKEPLTPTSANPELAPGVDAVLLRGLARDPEERWASCVDMLDALAAALRGDAPAPAGVAAPAAVPVAKPTPAPVVTPVAAPPLAPGPVEPPGERAPKSARPARKRLTRARVIAGLSALLILAAGTTAVVISTAHRAPPPPPALTLDASITSLYPGASTLVTASGLPPNQSVTVDLTGGTAVVQVGTGHADASGSLSQQVTVPDSTPTGNLVLQVCWQAACHGRVPVQIQAISAAATITVTPNPLRIGLPFSVSGQNFLPDGHLQFFLVQGTNRQQVGATPSSSGSSATVSADGSFTLSDTVPPSYQPGAATLDRCAYIPLKSCINKISTPVTLST